MTRPQWATGVAEVVAVRGRNVVVACPHCNGTHEHARSFVGSNAVVAGCHTGFSRCRQYRVLDLGSRRRAS